MRMMERERCTVTECLVSIGNRSTVTQTKRFVLWKKKLSLEFSLKKKANRETEPPGILPPLLTTSSGFNSYYLVLDQYTNECMISFLILFYVFMVSGCCLETCKLTHCSLDKHVVHPLKSSRWSSEATVVVFCIEEDKSQTGLSNPWGKFAVLVTWQTGMIWKNSR